MSFEIRPATRQGPQGALVQRSKRCLYAATNDTANGTRRTVLMHDLIMGCLLVDHRDNNGLNNRRANLRPATKSQNAANSKRSNTTSKFRGVNWDSVRQKWAAYIRVNGKCKNLGRFQTEQEAADAYLAAARPVYGDFVYTPSL